MVIFKDQHAEEGGGGIDPLQTNYYCKEVWLICIVLNGLLKNGSLTGLVHFLQCLTGCCHSSEYVQISTH